MSIEALAVDVIKTRWKELEAVASEATARANRLEEQNKVMAARDSRLTMAKVAERDTHRTQLHFALDYDPAFMAGPAAFVREVLMRVLMDFSTKINQANTP